MTDTDVTLSRRLHGNRVKLLGEVTIVCRNDLTPLLCVVWNLINYDEKGRGLARCVPRWGNVDRSNSLFRLRDAFEFFAYNDYNLSKTGKRSGREWVKTEKKRTERARVYILVLICGTEATDGISNWTDETDETRPWGGSVASIQTRVHRRTHSRNECYVHFESSILVSIILEPFSRGVRARIAGNNSYVCL